MLKSVRMKKSTLLTNRSCSTSSMGRFLAIYSQRASGIALSYVYTKRWNDYSFWAVLHEFRVGICNLSTLMLDGIADTNCHLQRIHFSVNG